ncbi:MAG: glycosyltransferase [Actinomycetota bacterium]|jgi:glycosyltransferase involved in cell wall biosynthesis|nr:glycosyltransferase [Actinomycetota bacterium]
MKEDSIADNNNIKGKIIPEISFITTVYNEENDITEFLESLMNGTHLPEEIVIVDGGSVDLTFNKILDFFNIEIGKDEDKNYNNKQVAVESSGTQSDIIKGIKTMIKSVDGSSGDNTKNKEYINIKIIRKNGANISQGRNEAIKNSSGSIICASDAGCILDRNWLFEISRFYGDDSCNVVGGMNLPYCRSFLQKCLAVCIMPFREEIREKKYMPSSRNISFRKKVWAETGGYPESMDYGEDMKFNFNIKKGGYTIKFNPDAVVYWKMRENPVQISRQFFRYAKGDATGRMYPYRHLIRLIAFLLILAIISSAFYLNRWILLALIPLFIIYTFKPYKRLVRLFRSKGTDSCSFYGKEKILSIFLIPFMLLQIDISKMCGYIYGLTRNI